MRRYEVVKVASIAEAKAKLSDYVERCRSFVRRFTEALRPGAYLRIFVEGLVGAGDEIRVVERSGHGVSIRDVFRIYSRDREEAGRLLTVPRMSESWKAWANNLLRKARSGAPHAAEPGCC